MATVTIETRSFSRSCVPDVGELLKKGWKEVEFGRNEGRRRIVVSVEDLGWFATVTRHIGGPNTSLFHRITEQERKEVFEGDFRLGWSAGEASKVIREVLEKWCLEGWEVVIVCGGWGRDRWDLEMKMAKEAKLRARLLGRAFSGYSWTERKALDSMHETPWPGREWLRRVVKAQVSILSRRFVSSLRFLHFSGESHAGVAAFVRDSVAKEEGDGEEGKEKRGRRGKESLAKTVVVTLRGHVLAYSFGRRVKDLVEVVLMESASGGLVGRKLVGFDVDAWVMHLTGSEHTPHLVPLLFTLISNPRLTLAANDSVHGAVDRLASISTLSVVEVGDGKWKMRAVVDGSGGMKKKKKQRKKEERGGMRTKQSTVERMEITAFAINKLSTTLTRHFSRPPSIKETIKALREVASIGDGSGQGEGGVDGCREMGEKGEGSGGSGGGEGRGEGEEGGGVGDESEDGGMGLGATMISSLEAMRELDRDLAQALWYCELEAERMALAPLQLLPGGPRALSSLLQPPPPPTPTSMIPEFVVFEDDSAGCEDPLSPPSSDVVLLGRRHMVAWASSIANNGIVAMEARRDGSKGASLHPLLPLPLENGRNLIEQILGLTNLSLTSSPEDEEDDGNESKELFRGIPPAWVAIAVGIAHLGIVRARAGMPMHAFQVIAVGFSLAILTTKFQEEEEKESEVEGKGEGEAPEESDVEEEEPEDRGGKDGEKGELLEPKGGGSEGGGEGAVVEVGEDEEEGGGVDDGWTVVEPVRGGGKGSASGGGRGGRGGGGGGGGRRRLAFSESSLRFVSELRACLCLAADVIEAGGYSSAFPIAPASTWGAAELHELYVVGETAFAREKPKDERLPLGVELNASALERCAGQPPRGYDPALWASRCRNPFKHILTLPLPPERSKKEKECELLGEKRRKKWHRASNEAAVDEIVNTAAEIGVRKHLATYVPKFLQLVVSLSSCEPACIMEATNITQKLTFG